MQSIWNQRKFIFFDRNSKRMLAEQLINNRNSKEHTESIAVLVCNKPEMLRQLIDLFQAGPGRTTQRAAWVLALIGEKKPDILRPFSATLVAKAMDAADGVKRNVLRILQGKQLAEDLHGDVMNLCFNALENPNEAVAIKSFAMGILGDLSKIYPEIKNELRLLIEAGMEQEPTPGYKSKAKKVLQQIK